MWSWRKKASTLKENHVKSANKAKALAKKKRKISAKSRKRNKKN